MTTGEVTLEDVLGMIARLKAREPHPRCREGGGPLAPLAVALNRLSLELSSARAQVEDIFGAQALLSLSPNVMFSCDLQARIRFVNYVTPPFKWEDIVGTRIYDWAAPESLELARATVQKVLTTGEPGGYEARSQGAKGFEWMAARIGPIKAGSRIVGFTVILTDIRELKQRQARLERSNQELESFAHIASHDLQEPLRKIQTFGERLKATASAPLPPESLDYIERMQQAATRMRQLIDDLLSFSRISSKARPFVPVDLGVVAREVLGDLETAIERSGAHVSLGELPVLEADPSQMRQLLQNLLSNALKFRREDTPPLVSVHATVDPRTERFELVVQDTGIGFEEKYAERIFEVFQRLHGRGQYEGTGIGLAICRKIAERHGGSITARSTPGQGSTFTVSLPLHPPDAPRVPVPSV